MTLDITGLAVALIGLLAAIITRYVIPWIKSKTTEAQQRTIRAWAAIAVSAAEMIYSGPSKGEEKLRYATDYLAERGIKLDPIALRAAVEAAVLDLKMSDAAIKAEIAKAAPEGGI